MTLSRVLGYINISNEKIIKSILLLIKKLSLPIFNPLRFSNYKFGETDEDWAKAYLGPCQTSNSEVLPKYLKIFRP